MRSRRICYICVFCLWLVLCGGCYIPTLDDIILRPSEKIRHRPDELGYQYDEVRLAVGYDRSIVLWHVFSEESKGLVFIIPGMDANKGWYVKFLPIYVDNGYDVILMDYEGFGDSGGEETLSNMIEDSFAVARYAQSQHQTVICYGVSIGSAQAVRVAAEMEFSACIFEACLILSQEAHLWLQDHGVSAPLLWMFAERYMDPQVPQDYDILKYITMVNEPKLFLHSREDNVTPYIGGVKVYQAASSPKQFWTIRGDHGKMVVEETELYTETIIDWLDQVVGGGE